MGITRIPKGLDSARKTVTLAEQIADLKEIIAHGKTYTNKDYGGLELRLEALLQQQLKEKK